MIGILITKFFAALCHSSCLRLILAAFCLAGIVLFALPFSVRIINLGNVFGLAVCMFLLSCVIFRTKLLAFSESVVSHRGGRITFAAIEIVILLGILYCAVITALMLHAANKKPETSPKAMIVLGCKVRGTNPSMMLYRRIQAAYDAMKEYPDIKVIVSGGQGSDEEISEAQCMYDTLCSLGADESRIILEDRSETTSENMKFSKAILEKEQISPNSVILIVSDSYHEMRAQMLAGYEGITNCYPVSASTSFYLVPTYYVREWFGIAHAFVFHS